MAVSGWGPFSRWRRTRELGAPPAGGPAGAGRGPGGGLAFVARRYLALGLFKLLKVETKLQDLWFFRLWSQGLQGRKPTDSMAAFIFYIILFMAILVAIRMLGVEGGESILTSLLGVVPRVLSFMLILFLGTLLAMFFSVVAQLALVGSGVQHPGFWGKVIAWCTFGVTVIFSLEPLGLVGRFLTAAVFTVLGV